MKCHYEVLEVPRDADDGEIKSAYRKLALKWHPDKNLDNTEYAKEQFQLVQQAYEVLSDKHERAWYDNHREQILYGANSQFQDNSLDVFQFFGNCFKGYGDDENGFYTVYRNVFDKIAKEDMDFMEDKEEYCNIPSFGNSQSDYEKVAEFYAYWSNYMTKKSYVWLDPHDIRDIRDRRYLKLVEKENKKVRQNAKKERNDEIRNLVAFVRKRDKRVQNQKKVLQEKQLLSKKKREQLSREKKLQRQQELNNSKVQPEWAKFDNFRTELEELEKTLAEEFGDNISNSEGESEDELNSLYCVACNKLFKTPKSFENHESSKKHKENVELLKTTLLNEENFASNNSENVDSDVESGQETSDNPFSENATNFESNMLESNDDLDMNSSNSDIQGPQIKTKRKKKQKNVMISHESEDLGTNDVTISFDIHSDNDDFSSSKKQKKGKKKANKNDSLIVSTPGKEEEKQDELVENNKTKKNKKDKRHKTNDPVTTNDVDINHNCLTCKSVFPSKNKLFDHLKKTGHGVYVDSNLKSKKSRQHINKE